MFEWFKNLFSSPAKRLKNAQASTRFISMRFGEAITMGDSGPQATPPPDQRKEVLPVDIIHEMEVKTEVDLEELDDKLKDLYRRSDFHLKTLKRKSVPADLEHAIHMLKARKKYPKVEHLITWPTTTQEKIDMLLAKYKLDHKSISEFIPEFPENAVKEIEQFEEMWKLSTKGIFPEDPELNLSIIAPPKMFKKKAADPILLAQSPFGHFFYILCAWDKEVNFVEELLDESKRKKE